jgi:hypothetical protein
MRDVAAREPRAATLLFHAAMPLPDFYLPPPP